MEKGKFILQFSLCREFIGYLAWVTETLYLLDCFARPFDLSLSHLLEIDYNSWHYFQEEINQREPEIMISQHLRESPNICFYIFIIPDTEATLLISLLRYTSEIIILFSLCWYHFLLKNDKISEILITWKK